MSVDGLVHDGEYSSDDHLVIELGIIYLSVVPSSTMESTRLTVTWSTGSAERVCLSTPCSTMQNTRLMTTWSTDSLLQGECSFDGHLVIEFGVEKLVYRFRVHDGEYSPNNHLIRDEEGSSVDPFSPRWRRLV